MVRACFAPSPTGSLHTGGARADLFDRLDGPRHSGRPAFRTDDADLEQLDLGWGKDRIVKRLGKC